MHSSTAIASREASCGGSVFCGNNADVQAPMGFPDRVVVVISGTFEIQPLVISPCPLADLDIPCLFWLSWQIRGGEGCTVQRAHAHDRFHVPLPQSTATRVCGAAIRSGNSDAAQRKQWLGYPQGPTEAANNQSGPQRTRKQRLDFITGACQVGVVTYLVFFASPGRGCAGRCNADYCICASFFMTRCASARCG